MKLKGTAFIKEVIEKGLEKRKTYKNDNYGTYFIGYRKGKFTKKDLLKFSPENRLIFLRAYYFRAHKLSNDSYSINISYHTLLWNTNTILSFEDVKELLFSMTISDNYETTKFILGYQEALKIARKSIRSAIKLKKELEKAGEWK